MKKYILLVLFIFVLTIVSGCENVTVSEDNPYLTKNDKKLMLDSAKGSDIIAYHNIKDKLKLKWLETYVAKGIKSNYDINIKFVYKPLDEYYKKLNEQYLEEDNNGKFDLLIYDDDSFKKLKQNNLLYGPFITKLENNFSYQDPDNYEINYDEGIAIEGHEALLGREQLIFVYDEDSLENPPSSPNELLEILKENKGKFSYVDPSTELGRAFINSIFLSNVDYEEFYARDDYTLDELKTIMKDGLSFFNDLKLYMKYKDGRLPQNQDEIDEMFYKNEIMFSMTFDIDHASTVSKLDLYPLGAKEFVFDTGTTGQNFYAAIPFNSNNKSAAILSINYMISLEAQNYKYDPKKWGNLPSLDSEYMKSEDAKILRKVNLKRSDMKEENLLSVRIPEVPKVISDKLYELWKIEINSKKSEGE